MKSFSFSKWPLMGCGQLVRLFGQAEPLPYCSGLESCSWGGSEDTEEVGLSATGSGAGCARACGVRRTYGKGSSGSSTGSPWNIIFFLLCSFFWAVGAEMPYTVPVHSWKILSMGAGSVLLEARCLCIETDLDALESLVQCLDSWQVKSALWWSSNSKGWPIRLT